ncbi:hypothetical protein NDU88_003451 [Pleurodeles waltl]|uniref:Uncharacterized protein n=1 Tax=Pleurodeles waltl TaxID=8319 RepID=A0AAV7TNG4_PLEWA|nr:hypothetical protein NDU88_003451 [Pleurodeles waltl]
MCCVRTYPGAFRGSELLGTSKKVESVVAEGGAVKIFVKRSTAASEAARLDFSLRERLCVMSGYDCPVNLDCSSRLHYVVG